MLYCSKELPMLLLLLLLSESDSASRRLHIEQHKIIMHVKIQKKHIAINDPNKALNELNATPPLPCEFEIVVVTVDFVGALLTGCRSVGTLDGLDVR